MDLSFVDLWWFSRRVVAIICRNAEISLEEVPTQNLLECMLQNAYPFSPIVPNFDLWRLNFEVLDDDKSGGLSEKQILIGVAQLVSSLKRLNVLDVKAAKSLSEELPGIIQSVLSSFPEDEDSDSDEVLDERKESNERLSSAQYRCLLVDVLKRIVVKLRPRFVLL